MPVEKIMHPDSQATGEARRKKRGHDTQVGRRFNHSCRNHVIVAGIFAIECFFVEHGRQVGSSGFLEKFSAQELPVTNLFVPGGNEALVTFSM